MFKIYSKPNCQYCTMAKEHMQKLNVEYQEVVIGVDIDRDSFIMEYPEVRSVPLIFKGDEKIGGYNELIEHFSKQF